MDNQWILDTHGDPVGKVRSIIKNCWQEYHLEGMLVTMSLGDATHAVPQLVTDPAILDEVNPFQPLMELNAARLIPGILSSHPHGRIGALLRPCEQRALLEMKRNTSISFENLLTISVDCLGTLPADEYQWRLDRLAKNLPVNSPPVSADSDALAHEALQFARQGGIIPYRYRTACQVCASPAADQADVNIFILGLPIRQKIIVSIQDQKIAEQVKINDYANGFADQALLSQHDRLLSRMHERHARLMERLNTGLGHLLPADVDTLIHQLEACGDCQLCMDACPICSVERPLRDLNGLYDRAGVIRWLVSCAGCGMCEQACRDHLPTSVIFAHIRKQLIAL